MATDLDALLARLDAAQRTDLTVDERSDLFGEARDAIAKLRTDLTRHHSAQSKAMVDLGMLGAENGVTWAMDGHISSAVAIAEETVRRLKEAPLQAEAIRDELYVYGVAAEYRPEDEADIIGEIAAAVAAHRPVTVPGAIAGWVADRGALHADRAQILNAWKRVTPLA